jgi:hypothetical protein
LKAPILKAEKSYIKPTITNNEENKIHQKAILDHALNIKNLNCLPAKMQFFRERKWWNSI